MKLHWRKTASRLFVAALFTGSFCVPSAMAGLIHSYTFDAGSVHDGIGSAEGALVGGATVSGGVLHLNGSTGYVQFSTNLIPSSGSMSVAFFAQRTSNPWWSYTEMISQGNGFYLATSTTFGFTTTSSPLRKCRPWFPRQIFSQ